MTLARPFHRSLWAHRSETLLQTDAAEDAARPLGRKETHQ